MKNKFHLIVNSNYDKKERFFVKKELRSILNLYAKKVSLGDWKDYGLSINKNYLMLLPPSTGIVNPVIKVEASLARK